MANTRLNASTSLAGLPYEDRVREVKGIQVLGWLRMGWSDMRRAGWASSAYGAMFVAIGLALTVGLTMVGTAYLIAPMIGAFLLVGPLLTLGFYQMSKDIEEGRQPGFLRALLAWRANPYHILTAGLVLMLFVMIWVRLNVIAFALFFPYVSMSFSSLLAQTFTLDGIAFTLFVTVLGFGFAAIAFVTNVTALPMMLDRQEDIFAAALVSIVAVLKSPRAIALWAGLIVLITGIGMATAMLGLIVTLPLIGHCGTNNGLTKREAGIGWDFWGSGGMKALGCLGGGGFDRGIVKPCVAGRYPPPTPHGLTGRPEWPRA